ncbi:MAG TPA: hypothetical protein VJL80_09970 [Aeromicrobium sp.]|nr:hypothetical protein [Aeromicrobium sp.]HKY58353.1 hypothetical protein [Aeromicrobium sp.]
MTRPNQHPTVTRAEEGRIVELYQAGQSIIDVAALVDRSDGLVRRVLRDRGVQMRPPGRRRSTFSIAPTFDDSTAFTGRWVRVGLTWKPTEQEAS